MVSHFGGKIADLKTFLLEERLTNGWEPTANDAAGFTMMKFNNAIISIEMLVNEGEFKVKKD